MNILEKLGVIPIRGKIVMGGGVEYSYVILYFERNVPIEKREIQQSLYATAPKMWQVLFDAIPAIFATDTQYKAGVQKAMVEVIEEAAGGQTYEELKELIHEC